MFFKSEILMIPRQPRYPTEQRRVGGQLLVSMSALNGRTFKAYGLANPSSHGLSSKSTTGKRGNQLLQVAQARAAQQRPAGTERPAKAAEQTSVPSAGETDATAWLDLRSWGGSIYRSAKLCRAPSQERIRTQQRTAAIPRLYGPRGGRISTSCWVH